eukprot:Pompholyxophrys_punicea_v1_NODE_568_length_1676_cov_8.374460.p1 type:complete len:463 gc:universal NODE_568_length_1676_cov_8.374460:274-1662(+)
MNDRSLWLLFIILLQTAGVFYLISKNMNQNAGVFVPPKSINATYLDMLNECTLQLQEYQKKILEYQQLEFQEKKSEKVAFQENQKNGKLEFQENQKNETVEFQENQKNGKVGFQENQKNEKVECQENQKDEKLEFQDQKNGNYFCKSYNNSFLVQQSLHHFPNITKEIFEESRGIPEGGIIFQIISGVLYIREEVPGYSKRNADMKLLIRDVLTLSDYSLPDTEFVVSTSDPPRFPFTSTFSFSRQLGQHLILIPDFTFGIWPDNSNYNNYREAYERIRNASEIPWSKRSSKILFRGQISGQKTEAKKIADENPAEFDMSSDRIDIEEFCKSKYLLHLNGVGAGAYSSKFKYLLMCGSAVLYSAPFYFEEWWSPLFFPGLHYQVTNHTNLLSDAKLMLSKDEENFVMGQRAKALALKILEPKNVMCYLIELIQEYSRRLTYTPELHEKSVRLDANIMENFKY